MLELSSESLLLQERLLRLRGDPTLPPQASIVIPVNAQKDLITVFQVLSDIGKYSGNNSAEIILVVNNYPEDNLPSEVELYREICVKVVAIPKIVKTGRVAAIAQVARVPGIQIAQSEIVLLFDADCRIPHATDLIDWYISQFENGFDLAYTHVDYFDLPTGISVKARMLIHHSTRWFRRTVLGLPTPRGSNYAIRKRLILDLFAQGRALHELYIGPEVKKIGGRIAYSGAEKLTVFTSGRFFSGGWKELFSYLAWRIGFYKRILNTRSKAASTERQEV